MTEPDRLFLADLARAAQAVEACLDGLLSPEPGADEIARPSRLLAAMRHGVLNGGKRLRPYLVLESARLCGGDHLAALRIAAALECIHCYSLVHDDLPAMDDDDLRRGQPTVHIAFDEATAILAGDSLLTLAFDIAAAPETPLSGESRAALVVALARAAGIGGMAGGQALDLAAELSPPDEAGIVTLQAMKTGALIRFACEAGALIAGADAATQASLRRYGEVIGRAFQIADDLLDITSDAASLGKATGKDEGRGKGTLVGLRGIDWAREELGRLVAEAEDLLSPFAEKGETLKAAARFVANRKN
ncbi:farnesyl-diphosphate synthase [Rhizobium rhizosphaerae]|uniref:Probable farnesyl diphosphate synthase n=1 Tax=Xaviernesmea rhizosphaerae TaxID=1672749 RepID=A0A1Q9AL48_9HYPH|nr:farnesyl diphosphate synthase [Xaviernesmea rhizosphaerae]OLP56032.1 farnesyl-diphosphate synthase [Xaviernesmea rhizosphaerae]